MTTRILLAVLLLPAMGWAGGPWVVSTATKSTGGTTYTRVTRPTAETGDYVILCFKKGDDPAIDGTPTGFTEIYKYGTNDGTDQYWGMWYRKITSSEANTVDTVKHTADNDETTAGEILVRGVHGTTPFDTTWVTANHFIFVQDSNDLVVPSITTTSDSALVITFVGGSHIIATTTVTNPSGHTRAWVLPGTSVLTSDASCASYYLKVSAGSTGVMVWDTDITSGAQDTYCGVIALKWDGTSRPPATPSQVMRVTIQE